MLHDPATFVSTLPPLVEHRDLGEHAPVLEALLEIRFPSLGVAVEDFREFGVALGEFPKVQEQIEFRAEISKEDDLATPTFIKELVGLIFIEADDRRVVHVRRDRFAVVAFRPYPGWEELLNFARSTWTRFLTTARPPAITQASLRYINRLPSQLPRLADFRTPSPGVLGAQQQHFQRLSFRHPHDPSYTGTVTYGTSPKEESNVMFDVLVRANVEMAPPDEELWERFRNLRTFKNDLFFSYLPVASWT